MSAIPSPSRPDPDRAEKFIAIHQQKYSELMDQCRQAGETTATPGWQAIYASRMSDHRGIVKRAAENIIANANYIKSFDSSEDSEKFIRDLVKNIAEERTRHEAWYSRSVSPFKEPVEAAARVIENLLREVTDAERAATLTARGLAAEVQKLVETWPTATWNEKVGVVEVNEKH